MDEVLKDINKKYISLPEHEVARNKQILKEVLETFVNKMKTKDLLFNAMFRCVFYGGSFYDGLKVGHPTEFDLDLLLCIPKKCEPVLKNAEEPGYVHLQAQNISSWKRQPESKPVYYDNFEKLLFDEEHYLSSNKVFSWIQGIVQTCLNDYDKISANKYMLRINDLGVFTITYKKSGPAVTINISGAEVNMDVDLVACFVFSEDQWPYGFTENPFPGTEDEFFIVPKEPKNPKSTDPYWRLSFQKQERALMANKQVFKSAIKLIKKLRDNFDHSIASYHIKTVGLHVISEQDESFWRKSLSHVFMCILKEYRNFIKDENIPYYWFESDNLISDKKSATLQNISGCLTYIIKDIENNPDKLETVAKYFDFKTVAPPKFNEENSRCALL